MPITQEQCNNLKKHEGFRNKVYKCTAGKDTIGYGYNIAANPLKLSALEIRSFYDIGITEAKAEVLLKLCCNMMESQLTKELNWFNDLDSNSRYVILNMSYNIGVRGLLGFHTTLSLIKDGKLAEASTQMLRSKWANQVKIRAIELSTILRTGKIR